MKSIICLLLIVYVNGVTSRVLSRTEHRSCATYTCPYGTVCKQKIVYCRVAPCRQPPPTCERIPQRRLETCEAMTCPPGTVCKQKRLFCRRQPCYQPPAICETVIYPNPPRDPTCPPGFKNDYYRGRPEPCSIILECAKGSHCMSSGVSGLNICCSRDIHYDLRYQPELEYQHIRQLEVEPVQLNVPEVEYRTSCPEGFTPDFIQGRSVACSNISPCDPGSRCLSSGMHSQFICCKRTASPQNHRVDNAKLRRHDPYLAYGNVNRQNTYAQNIDIRMQPTRQHTVSYGNIQHRNFNRGNVRPWKLGRQQPRMKNGNIGLPPVKGNNMRQQMIVSRLSQPTLNSPTGNQQGSCPTGHHTKSFSGRELSCVSSSQCPHGSSCTSTGLFKGAVCCAKNVQISKNTRFCPFPRRRNDADCRQLCSSDRNCSGRMKCCFNGCGKTCLIPIFS